MESKISLEETEEQEYLEKGRVYKISNLKELSKKDLKEEWEELFKSYEELQDEIENEKKEFLRLLETTLKNMDFKTEEIKQFSKPIIRNFLKEFRRNINGKKDN